MVDLSLHILDVATNAFKANAKMVKIVVKEEENCIQVWIEDDGCGMSKEILEHVSNPFFTSRKTRHVGLGIPLFKQTCEQTGGFLKITSEVGIGTTVHALMYTSHIDSIPLGDMGESLFVLMMNPYGVDVHAEMIFKNQNKKTFIIDTKDLRDILDGVPLTEPSVMTWIKEYIADGIKNGASE